MGAGGAAREEARYPVAQHAHIADAPVAESHRRRARLLPVAGNAVSHGQRVTRTVSAPDQSIATPAICLRRGGKLIDALLLLDFGFPGDFGVLPEVLLQELSELLGRAADRLEV